MTEDVFLFTIFLCGKLSNYQDYVLKCKERKRVFLVLLDIKLLFTCLVGGKGKLLIQSDQFKTIQKWLFCSVAKQCLWNYP